MRSSQVFDILEGVYSEIWYLEERGRFRKYKGDSSWVWEKIEYKSKTIKEVRHSKRKRP